MSVLIEGKCGIKAEIILHSVSEAGQEIITYVIDVPRMVWSEVMTHRMFSRNAASSRAIPFAAMQEQLTARPVRFGQSNSGMQDRGEDFDSGVDITFSGPEQGWGVPPEQAWEVVKNKVVQHSRAFKEAGYHKQVYNRLIEPFQMIRAVITATSFDNFFWLRCDSAADPTIEELANCMYKAKQQSVPQHLKEGEWHLPFVDVHWCGSDESSGDKDLWQSFYIGDEEISLEDAKKVCAARCAAVSFRKDGLYGLEKSKEVWERLVRDERKHASALEHAARVMYIESWWEDTVYWEEGITHMDRNGEYWSGNFKGFIQLRQLLDNHTCYDYEKAKNSA